jgi:hypothetical protein
MSCISLSVNGSDAFWDSTGVTTGKKEMTANPKQMIINLTTFSILYVNLSRSTKFYQMLCL